MPILSDQEFASQVFEIADQAKEPFKPFVFDNVAGDCLEFFISNGDYFAERIDDYLTLYLDMDSEQIIGFVIKNVRHILDRLSKQKLMMAFVIEDGTIQLRSLFVSMFADENPEQNNRRDMLVRQYKKVIKLAETNKLSEVKFAYAGC